MQFCGSGWRRKASVITSNSIWLLNKLLSLVTQISTRRQGRRKRIAPPTRKAVNVMWHYATCWNMYTLNRK